MPKIGDDILQMLIRRRPLLYYDFAAALNILNPLTVPRTISDPASVGNIGYSRGKEGISLVQKRF